MPRSTPPKRMNALHAFGTALRPCMQPYNQPSKRCAGIRTRTNGTPFFASNDSVPHKQPPRSPQTTARVHPAPMTLRSSQATTLSLTNSRCVLHEQTARVHPAPITLRSSQAMAQRFSDDRFRLHKPRGTAPPACGRSPLHRTTPASRRQRPQRHDKRLCFGFVAPNHPSAINAAADPPIRHRDRTPRLP